MQFSETQMTPVVLPSMSKANQIHRTRPWPDFPTSKSLSSFGDANCMEQLLVHCANAIESNDATMTQQILWVLNTIAPPDGDSNQRLASGFLRALIARAAMSGNCQLLSAAMENVNANLSIDTHKFSAVELASFVDLTPWHRFGYTAANAAVLEAVEGYSIVHIVDFSLTRCMQIPTLIDAIATRFEVPPLVKLTVAAVTEPIPPTMDISYEELGSKLINFARSRNVSLEFNVISTTFSDGFSSLIDHLQMQQMVIRPESEALIINCHMMLHYIPEEMIRAMFLKSIRTLDPTLFVLVDEDADLTSKHLVTRLRSAFNYLWIPFDTADTFLVRGSKQRQWYEADISWKIQNVIAQEGLDRVERLEPKNKWAQRMRNSGFRGVGFSEDGFSEVKSMLDEHAAGWGMKREEDQDLVLTWKGHNVVFATAWVSAA